MKQGKKSLTGYRRRSISNSYLQAFFWISGIFSLSITLVLTIFYEIQATWLYSIILVIWLSGFGATVFFAFRSRKISNEIEKTITDFQNSELYYQEIVKQSIDGIVLSDKTGNIIEWNESIEQITGYDKEDALGESIWEIQQKLSDQKVLENETPEKLRDNYLNALVNHEGEWLKEIHDAKITRKDGQKREVEQVFFPIKVFGSSYLGSFIRDVSEKRQIEDQLRQSEERYRELYENMPLGYHSLNKNGEIIEINDSWLNELGYKSEEVLNKPFSDFLDDESKKKFKERFPIFIKEGHTKGVEFGIHRKSGKTIIIRIDGRARYDREGNFIQSHCVFYNITNQKKLERELNQLAITDSLTGLYNRRHFFNLAEKEFSRTVRHQYSLAIMIFDIDHFKLVNDTYGHLVGDQILEHIADDSQTMLRDFDILGRYGGEEFVVMMPQTDANSALNVAERLRSFIEELQFRTTKGTMHLTISIGVAEKLKSDTVVENLLDRADQALYQAKQGGRNQTRVWKPFP